MVYTIPEMTTFDGHTGLREVWADPGYAAYYGKIGVIPIVSRTSGGARNNDGEAIGWVENAVCMRSAGVPVESIAEYVKLYKAGDEFPEARRDIPDVPADFAKRAGQ